MKKLQISIGILWSLRIGAALRKVRHRVQRVEQNKERGVQDGQYRGNQADPFDPAEKGDSGDTPDEAGGNNRLYGGHGIIILPGVTIINQARGEFRGVAVDGEGMMYRVLGHPRPQSGVEIRNAVVDHLLAHFCLN
jgi:hypothetical protein